MGIGIFGGGGSSSNTTKNFSETTTLGAATGGLSAQNSTIISTPSGAFDTVKKTTSGALSTASNAINKVLDFATSTVAANKALATDTISAAAATAKQSQQNAVTAQTSANNFSEQALVRTTASSAASTESLGKYAIMAAGVFAVVSAFKK